MLSIHFPNLGPLLGLGFRGQGLGSRKNGLGFLVKGLEKNHRGIGEKLRWVLARSGKTIQWFDSISWTDDGRRTNDRRKKSHRLVPVTLQVIEFLSEIFCCPG